MLEFRGLTKRYGPVTVLSDVSLTLHPGRVHALMGENGAGKSTFIKLLAGVTPASSMTILRDGQLIPLRKPADAATAGFRVIHQELNIVPQLSVAENILLGHPTPHRLGFVNWLALNQRATAALAELGVTLDVTRQAGQLGTGDRMLVKIASALVGGQTPCLYVLDEPTAALSQAESARLFKVITRLKQQGAAILYVSHRLDEVMAICDEVTVLRNGAKVFTAPIAQTSRDEIIQQMTGRSLTEATPRTIPRAKPAVHLHTLCSPSLHNLSFTLNEGEVLGIAGLAGAGQDALLNLFLGLEKPTHGHITVLGGKAPANPAEAWLRSIAYVPPERRAQGLAMRMGSRANALMPHYRGLRARVRPEQARTRALAAQVSLKSSGPEQSVWQLSGGNQQKVVFARALAENPRLLLLNEPTRGVDVGAKAEIYALIRAATDQGCAVLLASSDLPELITLSNRILVLHQGRQDQILNLEGLEPASLLHALYQTEPK
jgi:ribose transport system ATP-binding protein